MRVVYQRSLRLAGLLLEHLKYVDREIAPARNGLGTPEMMKYRILGILGLALMLRLYHVDFPVAGWHSWRQADTAAIARNFSENGFRLFYPQIDWGGNSSGIVETEFQIYPFLVSLLYALFGVHDIIGRILSVCFSMGTIYALFLLVRKYFSERIALWSAFIYAIVPLNIYYGRAFMPESALLLCSVLGVYFFSQWLDHRNPREFVMAWFCVTLAVLLKLPTLYLGLPLLYLAWLRHGTSTFKQWTLWLFALLVLVPVALWYYHAHRLYLESGLTFGIWGFGTDKWGNLDIILTPKFYNDVFLKSIAERHLTYFGVVPFLVGLSIKRNTKEERLFDFWVVAVIAYFLIAARGNQVHEYYQLPFMVPAVVYAGRAFDKYLVAHVSSVHQAFGEGQSISLFFTLCLVGVFVLSYLRYHRFMSSETFNSSLFRLSTAVRNSTSKRDLVVSVSDGNPIVLYRCERKGWICGSDQLKGPEFLSNKRKAGAKYLIGETSFFNTPERQKILAQLYSDYPVAERGPDCFVIDIRRSD